MKDSELDKTLSLQQLGITGEDLLEYQNNRDRIRNKILSIAVLTLSACLLLALLFIFFSERLAAINKSTNKEPIALVNEPLPETHSNNTEIDENLDNAPIVFNTADLNNMDVRIWNKDLNHIALPCDFTVDSITVNPENFISYNDATFYIFDTGILYCAEFIKNYISPNRDILSDGAGGKPFIKTNSNLLKQSIEVLSTEQGNSIFKIKLLIPKESS